MQVARPPFRERENYLTTNLQYYTLKKQSFLCPMTEVSKETLCGEHFVFFYSCRGWRPHKEDAYTSPYKITTTRTTN